MIHILERFLVSSPSQCFVLQLQTTFKQVLNGWHQCVPYRWEMQRSLRILRQAGYRLRPKGDAIQHLPVSFGARHDSRAWLARSNSSHSWSTSPCPWSQTTIPSFDDRVGIHSVAATALGACTPYILVRLVTHRSRGPRPPAASLCSCLSMESLANPHLNLDDINKFKELQRIYIQNICRRIYEV